MLSFRLKVLLLLVCVQSVAFSQGNGEVNTEYSQSLQAIEQAIQSLDRTTSMPAIDLGDLGNMDIEKLLSSGNTARTKQNPTSPTVFIFISRSLPESTLTALFRQAEQASVPLVLRGFVGRSLNATMTYLQTYLINGKNNPAVLIDPLRYQAFAIDKVPAFIWVYGPPCLGPTAHCYNGNTDSPAHTTVYGDVSLRYALQQLASAVPHHANQLKPLLDKLQGDQE